MFSKAEEVGRIRRPPLVEEEFVLADDGGAEHFELPGIRDAGNQGFVQLTPTKRAASDMTQVLIPFSRKVDAILTANGYLGRRWTFRSTDHIQIQQGDKPRPALLRELLDGP